MRPENAIEVKNITKSFKVYFDKGNTIKEKLLFWKRSRHENRQVLRGISFDVKKGEAIGLVGHNGCGKSTTLKLLTKIMYPDSGSIEMKGRVCSLIELGAGFHPDMSGRENIYINASIFGLTKREIDARLEDIIAFSELEEFIDNPVRTYSSGMYMRLAFSVAINVDADILLVDEILAVGDSAFQHKCFSRLQEIKAEGTTIVIVSHALNQIEQICERSLWIHEGVIRAEGSPRDVHPLYQRYMAEKEQAIANAAARKAAENAAKRSGAQESIVRFKDAVLKDEKGERCVSFLHGQTAELEVTYEVTEDCENMLTGFAVHRIDGIHCYGTTTYRDQMELFSLKKGEHRVTIILPCVQLLGGTYTIDWALERVGDRELIYARDIAKLTVVDTTQEVGMFSVTHNWKLD